MSEGQGDRVVGLQDLGRGDKDDDRQGNQDDRDGLELALEISQSANLNGLSDFAHLGRTLIFSQDLTDQEESDSEGEKCRCYG